MKPIYILVKASNEMKMETAIFMEKNPKTQRQWRYTWEAQSHSPNLRLFLFDSITNPKLYCKSLNVCIIHGKSQLLVTWIDDEGEATGKEEGREEVSLRVPVPRVLIDGDSPVNFRALDDHIEVRLVLLLPVDHPVVSGFDLVYDSTGNREKSTFDVSSTPLVMDYDLKTLSSMGGVHFYCRNCSTRLTKKSIQDFSEMPSINWRESADNWFGNCCCSFGGISEKMVAKYTNSYTCSSGLCLLSATTVLLSEDDLMDCFLSDKNRIEIQFQSSLSVSDGLDEVESGCQKSEGNVITHENGGQSTHRLVDESMLHIENAEKGECNGGRVYAMDNASIPNCCVHSSPDSNESFQLDGTHLTPNKKFHLDGFLEDVFMAKASNVSKNVEWIELCCSECSSLLGVYPSGNNNGRSIDGGVRLFKCYISTSSSTSKSSDAFKNYTLEKMFTNQLVECSKEELSFHLLVKDLTTKSSLFQIVVLNPNSWSSTGLCSIQDETIEPSSTLELRPIVKVLYSDCSRSVKNIDEEVYILKRQGEKLMELLTTATKFLPSSCTCLQGSIVSSLHR